MGPTGKGIRTNTLLKRIPASVWALGLVSMFMDISSEMIHSLLPLFLVGTLGASAFLIGLIEGLAESTALIARYFPVHSATTWGNARLWLSLAIPWGR